MKKGIATLIIMLVLLLASAGCEEFLLGAGAGAAGKETLESWQSNLEGKKIELQQKYDAVMKEIETAPDPNALALAKAKLEPIQNAQLVNETALFTVKEILKMPESTNPESRKDALVVGGIGLVGLFIREWQKRILNKKYISMKTGQARLKTEQPEAEAKLYALIGEERRKLGL